MLRKDWADIDTNGARGDWFFFDEDNFIVIRYGDKVHNVVVLPIKPGNKGSWKWDGNKEAPTISPSIRVMGSKGKADLWHGFMEKGIIRDA